LSQLIACENTHNNAAKHLNKHKHTHNARAVRVYEVGNEIMREK